MIVVLANVECLLHLLDDARHDCCCFLSVAISMFEVAMINKFAVSDTFQNCRQLLQMSAIYGRSQRPVTAAAAQLPGHRGQMALP